MRGAHTAAIENMSMQCGLLEILVDVFHLVQTTDTSSHCPIDSISREDRFPCLLDTFIKILEYARIVSCIPICSFYLALTLDSLLGNVLLNQSFKNLKLIKY